MENIEEKPLKSFEEFKERDNQDYPKSKELLKKYFRTLYENAGIEWTEKNDKEIEFIIEAIVLRSSMITTEIVINMGKEIFGKKGS